SVQRAITFNENLQITEMKGSDIYDLFELIHDPEIFGNNAELMFSGLCVKIDHTRDTGHKVVWIKDLNGKDIDPEQILSVSTSKYMSTGGNGTRTFAERFNWRELNIKIHDAIAEYLKQKGRIKGETDGRYEFIGSPENNNSPW
ncbi:MAG: 5'-nucleotidase C-terminal domain-containing protein, partial [Erysipelotrichaceae bacterium]|nr:5'-nucleotidase C-terminal domain-containing protein [Erysipelotrichaceae bacterium]